MSDLVDRGVSVATGADTTTAAPGAAPAPAARRRRRRSRGGWLPYALIAPAVVFELLVHIIPMLVGVWIAFLRLTQLYLRNWSSAPFAGLSNFRLGLNPHNAIGSTLLSSAEVTLAFTVLSVGLAWLLGMLGAFLLNTSFRGRGFFRTLFLIPYALPAYVVVLTWGFMFNQRDGAVNQFLVGDLHLLGSRPFWLLGGIHSFAAIVIIETWKLWPFAFLMLLAALQNIPDELYEAAALDGATMWGAFRRITLAQIRPANTVLLLVMGLWTFNEFNTPYLLFGASPPASARLISEQIYINSFSDFNFGLGAAMSVLLLLALLGASLLYLRLVNQKGDAVDA
jgi:multiple sugar transport system permease protein